MKLLLISLTLLFTTSTVFADSFTIIKDDTTYYCEQTDSGNTNNPIGAADCSYKAVSNIGFSREQARDLCAGALSVSPADCAYKAVNNIGFSREQALTLCKRRGTVANADCAYKAVNNSGFSREDALQLCKTNPHLALKMLNLRQDNSPTKK